MQIFFSRPSLPAHLKRYSFRACHPIHFFPVRKSFHSMIRFNCTFFLPFMPGKPLHVVHIFKILKCMSPLLTNKKCSCFKILSLYLTRKLSHIFFHVWINTLQNSFYPFSPCPLKMFHRFYFLCLSRKKNVCKQQLYQGETKPPAFRTLHERFLE